MKKILIAMMLLPMLCAGQESEKPDSNEAGSSSKRDKEFEIVALYLKQGDTAKALGQCFKYAGDRAEKAGNQRLGSYVFGAIGGAFVVGAATRSLNPPLPPVMPTQPPSNASPSVKQTYQSQLSVYWADVASYDEDYRKWRNANKALYGVGGAIALVGVSLNIASSWNLKVSGLFMQEAGGIIKLTKTF